MTSILLLAAVVAVIILISGVIVLGLRTRRRQGRITPPAAPGPLPPPSAPPPVEAPTRAATGAPAPVEAPPAPAEGPDRLKPPIEEAVAPKRRFRDRLARARVTLSSALSTMLGRSAIDDETWEDLEEALVSCDVGIDLTTQILSDLEERARREGARDPGEIVILLKDELESLLEGEERGLAVNGEGMTTWLMVGVNGAGKTTTIAKLASREAAAGRSVVLAAADTFRAAAAEQLEIWAERTGAHLVRGQEGADPGSVVYDSIDAARSRGADLVIVDTAGRLHTKVNLMEELSKIRRVIEKANGGLTEVLLVIDATTGQNGLAQARQFTEAVGVTGIVLTKLDGSARGGIVLAVEKELGIPVKLVGLGEQAADLLDFEPDFFVEALFE